MIRAASGAACGLCEGSEGDKIDGVRDGIEMMMIIIIKFAPQEN